MYFLKSKDELVTSINRMDLSKYIDLFTFKQHLHKDKAEAFDDLLKKNPIFLADLAASIFSSMFAAGYLDRLSLAKALDCCRDIIQDMGFSEVDEEQIRHALTAEKDIINTILVAGCQDNDMLRGRTTKAVDFINTFKHNYVLVFSGRNPNPLGSDRIAIFNESQRMLIEFKQSFSAQHSGATLPVFHKITCENQSSTTRTNIAKFFEGKFLTPEKSNNLIIISSTFHLIRLAKELNTYLDEHSSINLANVILVGAENGGKENCGGKEFFMTDMALIKLMMFDVFDYLLRK